MEVFFEKNPRGTNIQPCKKLSASPLESYDDLYVWYRFKSFTKLGSHNSLLSFIV